ncbi:MAG: Uma2 family endonuclease [Dehalococcoidia bacterium]
MRTTRTTLRDSEYPESDGQPMAESDSHRNELLRLLQILAAFFARWRLVYVSGNNFIYYEPDNIHASVSPDVYVVKGVPKGERRVYFLWREGVAPQVVIELTSRSTRTNDQGEKRRLYERLGVHEYYLYDPLGEWLHPGLLGYRLGANGYEAMTSAVAGGLLSDELGMRLVLERGRLQFYDLSTGERLLSPEEQAEVALERAEAETQRADTERQRATGEAEARRAAEARADEADAARRAAEARLAELTALLHDRLPPTE